MTAPTHAKYDNEHRFDPDGSEKLYIYLTIIAAYLLHIISWSDFNFPSASSSDDYYEYEESDESYDSYGEFQTFSPPLLLLSEQYDAVKTCPASYTALVFYFILLHLFVSDHQTNVKQWCPKMQFLDCHFKKRWFSNQ